MKFQFNVFIYFLTILKNNNKLNFDNKNLFSLKTKNVTANIKFLLTIRRYSSLYITNRYICWYF